MRNKLVLSLLFPLVITGCASQGGNNPDSYSLVWSDEFDGTSLNENYWGYMTGNGHEYGNPGWGNSELEYYKRENVSVKDGNLYITAKAEETVTDNGTFQYTSARIRTTGKVAVKYGKIEARISLPAQKGMWPAFWMLPEDFTKYGQWPHCGEIDIMEANGNSDTGSTCALHFSTEEGVHNYITGAIDLDIDDSIENFHVYSVVWNKGYFKFYVDDEEIKSISRSEWSTGAVKKQDNPYAPFDQEFHILLNMAVGGNYVHGDNPYASFTKADMIVDYVRIYQKASERSEG